MSPVAGAAAPPAASPARGVRIAGPAGGNAGRCTAVAGHRAPVIAVRQLPMAAAPRQAVWTGRTELSKRETEVLFHVSLGHTTTHIAGALHLSEHTIRTHVARMFAKLDCANRAALVTIGFERGVLRPRHPAPVTPTLLLDQRLIELATLVAGGYTDQQIALRLSLSVDGVKYRMKKLYRELGAVAREHVVRLAVEAGLLRVRPGRRGGAVGWEAR